MTTRYEVEFYAHVRRIAMSLEQLADLQRLAALRERPGQWAAQEAAVLEKRLRLRDPDAD